MVRRQAKENNQNNNSNEKRKRDGIAVGCKSHDEFVSELKKKERKKKTKVDKKFAI